ncbi:MAG: hypothetical protein AAB587_02315 [Patescibacteria group bacterium]
MSQVLSVPQIKEPGQLALDALALVRRTRMSFEKASRSVVSSSIYPDLSGDIRKTVFSLMCQRMRERRKEKELREISRGSTIHRIPEHAKGHWSACKED